MAEKINEHNKSREVVRKMMRVNLLHRSVVDKRFAELNIHRNQHLMLLYLLQNGGSPSQKEIASHFDVTPAAVAMSIKKMEKIGLVERKQALLDNRVNVVSISQKGREIMEKSRQMFDEIDEVMFDGITDDEYEKLKSIFDRITDNLIRIGAEDEIPFQKVKFMKKKKSGSESINSVDERIDNVNEKMDEVR